MTTSAVTLTNLVTNGSFETNLSGWNGYSVSGQGAQSALTPTRVAVTSVHHGEVGSWCAQIGVKTQGVVFMNPVTPISVIVGNKYYIRARVRLRGSTVAGAVSTCTMVDGIGIPVAGTVAVDPLVSGLQTTITTSWVLIDAIWIADKNSLNPRFVWQTTANQGNNDLYGLLDNFMIIDLTTDIGEGIEPPLLAIRESCIDNIPSGYWDNQETVDVPSPPDIITNVIPNGIYGRSYSVQINIDPLYGTAPFSFSLYGLPQGHGLSINNSGLITGTLGIHEGEYELIVQVTDGYGYQIGKSFELDVCDAPEITNKYIPCAILNTAYSFTPNVSGSDGNLVISIHVSNGTIPTGLSISGITISGTPTVDEEECEITITAYNDCDPTPITQVFTLFVAYIPKINSVSPLPYGVVGDSYFFTFDVSGAPTIKWYHVSGALPPGITFKTTGSIGSDVISTPVALNVGVTALWSAIAYVGGTFSLISREGSGGNYGAGTRRWMVSTNNGTSWVAAGANTPPNAGTYQSICTNTGNRFLAGASNLAGGGSLMIWSNSGNPASRNTGTITALGLAFGAGNFVVVGGTTAGTTAVSDIFYHADGTANFFVRTGAIVGSAVTRWSALCFGNNLFVAVGDAGTGDRIATSPNGATTNFTLRTDPKRAAWKSVCWGLNQFLIVGFSDDYLISSDGITWGSGKLPYNKNWVKVRYDSSTAWWIVMASDGTLLLSKDGILWIEASLGSSNIWTDLISNNTGTWIAVSESGSDRVVRFTVVYSGASSNGIDDAFLMGVPTQAGTYSFYIKAENLYGSDTKLFSLTIHQLPVITTTSFGYARLNTPYNSVLQATGTTPITWAIVSGNLPTGLTLNPTTGAISGTPLVTGAYTFTVVATNPAGDSQPKTFTINAGMALGIITTSPLPSGIVGVLYSGITFKAEGIDASYAYNFTWVAQAGSSLPPGLTLNTTNVAAGGTQVNQGLVSGTPTADGTYYVNVTVTNGLITSTSPFTIVIGRIPLILSTQSFGGVINVADTAYMSASGSTPITWSITSGPSPSANIQLSSNGTLTWLIPNAGVYSFTVVATNQYGSSSPVTFTLTITDPGTVNETVFLYFDDDRVDYLFSDDEEIFELYENDELKFVNYQKEL